MTGALYGGAWTAWEDAADDAANIAWHTETMRLLEPFVVGHYVSETDTVAHPEYAERAYSPRTGGGWRNCGGCTTRTGCSSGSPAASTETLAIRN